MSFSENLKRLRMAKNYSMAKLSRMSDVSVSTLLNLEKDGVQNPTLPTVNKIALALNVTPEMLTDYSGDDIDKILTSTQNNYLTFTATMDGKRQLISRDLKIVWVDEWDDFIVIWCEKSNGKLISFEVKESIDEFLAIVGDKK